jgi:chromosome segregation ATPase
MSEPKRYHLYAGLECQAFTKAEAVLKFREEDDGIWVKWEDYARLKAEVERLTLENSQYEEHHKYGQNVITSLREEVERLTQLNDTLALRYDATNSMLDGCAKEIEEMEAEVEMLKGQVRYWKIEAECDHGRWLRCLEDLEKLRGQGGQP